MSTAMELLSELPFFPALSVGERDALAAIVKNSRLRSGEFVFQYGDPADSLYIVRSGEAEAFIEDSTGRRMVLEVITPGNYFGELALLDGGSRSASVIATQDLEMLRLDAEDFESFLLNNPKAAVHILRVMGSRLRNNVEMLRQTASRNVNDEIDVSPTRVQKVADWIADFSGSLPFLILNAVAFLVWILLNISLIPGVPLFDPYPFGLLTMGVSLEAIFLSIFVLISQNRQAEKDRIRGDIEYDVNLKAELEIANLHTKVDRLQAQFLAELSEIKKRALQPLAILAILIGQLLIGNSGICDESALRNMALPTPLSHYDVVKPGTLGVPLILALVNGKNQDQNVRGERSLSIL